LSTQLTDHQEHTAPELRSQICTFTKLIWGISMSIYKFSIFGVICLLLANLALAEQGPDHVAKKEVLRLKQIVDKRKPTIQIN
jgi:hypothetical protein